MTQSPASKNGSRLRQDLISGSYVRNAWYVAAWSDDIADGQVVARTIMGERVALYRKANGDVAAIEDRCAHRFAPLSMGKVVSGDRIQCPYHGLEFDGTGACVYNPHGTKKYSAAGAGEKLSGGREAQGDMDLDGRCARRRRQGAGFRCSR